MVSVGTAGEVRRLPWPQDFPPFFLLVRYLSLLGRAVIVSRLPYLPLPPFAFPPSPRHHDACLLCYEDRLISLVRYEGSPPQYRGYRVNPAASCGGILPRARICLGKGQGEGLLSNFSGKSSGKWSVNLSRLLIVANARGLRGGLGVLH